MIKSGTHSQAEVSRQLRIPARTVRYWKKAAIEAGTWDTGAEGDNNNDLVRPVPCAKDPGSGGHNHKIFTRDDKTPLHILMIDLLDLLLNKCFEGLLILRELSLACHQLGMAGLKGSDAGLGGHGDFNPVYGLFGDRDDGKVLSQRNVLGVAGGMGSA